MDTIIDKIVGNENTVKFWTDRWFLTIFFAHEYPALFFITTHPYILVERVFESQHLNLHFDYTLDGEYLREWQELSTVLQYFCTQHTV
jgi:hypothetical protein